MDLTNPQVRTNATYWFEPELRHYPAFDLDLPALLAGSRPAALCSLW
jgi:hypothetical protein